MNVISCLMSERIEECDYDTLISTINRLDFHDTAIRRVFEEIEKRHKAGKAFDRVAIESYFERTEEYDFDVDNIDFDNLEDDDDDEDESTGNDILDLFREIDTPDIRNIEAHIRELKELSQRRQIKRLGFKLIEDSENDEIESEYLASKTQNDLSDILDNNCDEDVYDAESCTDDVLNHLEERAKIEDEIYGQRTYFTGVDKILKGLQGSTLIIVGGRPAMGKSTFAFNMSTAIGLNGGHVLNYTLEMPKIELTMRIWSSIGGIEQDSMKAAKFSSFEKTRLADAVEQFRNSNIKISDKENLTVQKIKSDARKANREQKLDLIVVDYLQLMKIPDSDNKTNGIGEITRELKLLANELNIPIILLSQLNRDLEKRMDKRPINADLRDSGAIEQDADVIMFVYRDEVYYPDTEDKGIAEIIISKHRAGELGTVKLGFEGKFARFVNIKEEVIEDEVVYHDTVNHIYSSETPIENLPL